MILFVGNVLSGKGRASSYTEFLVGQLKDAFDDDLRLISSVRNRILRVLHALAFILIQRSEIRFVVIDTFSTSAFYYAYIVGWFCRLLRLRYVLVLHGGNLPQRYISSPNQVRRLFQGAYRIVSPSFYLARFFEGEGYLIDVISNALDIRHYAFRRRGAIAPRILWVRAFDKIYNPVLAIKSLKLVLAKFPSARLTMVGPVKDTSYQECVRYLKDEQLEGVVTLRGLLSREQWIAESVDYDIFLSTTSVDNQPVSLMEAMALGLLVVSTNVGGVPYLVKHAYNGILVPSGDEQAMSDAIIGILEMSDVARQTLSDNAREFAAQFDWERIQPKWLNVLR